MKEQPTLTTERLILRPYSPADAKDLQALIGDRDVADTLATVPYPYLDGMAEAWITQQSKEYEAGKSVTFAITDKLQRLLMGTVSLSAISNEHQKAVIGYWIGKSYWHQGYCTEAAGAVLRYGFEVLGTNRIYATHMTRNLRSGRVMQKIGMKHEGHLRQDCFKWGKFEDVEMRAILRSDYLSSENIL
jgi:[ribosomal protein S5]-alanine N-acetyltransferase